MTCFIFTDGLLGPGMAPWQGPALVAYNDAVFSEADFISISRIGDSVKRVQAGKTGRFG
jgi:sacsin